MPNCYAPSLKSAAIIAVLSGKLDSEQAATRFAVHPATLRRWVGEARRALATSTADSPLPAVVKKAARLLARLDAGTLATLPEKQQISVLRLIAGAGCAR